MHKNIFQIITIALTTILPIKKSHAEYLIKNDIIYTTQKSEKYCKISPAPKFLKITHDKTALILSETGYIPINLLENCSKVIFTKNIPTGVGILTDINLKKKNLYRIGLYWHTTSRLACHRWENWQQEKFDHITRRLFKK